MQEIMNVANKQKSISNFSFLCITYVPFQLLHTCPTLYKWSLSIRQWECFSCMALNLCVKTIIASIHLICSLNTDHFYFCYNKKFFKVNWKAKKWLNPTTLYIFSLQLFPVYPIVILMWSQGFCCICCKICVFTI